MIDRIALLALLCLGPHFGYGSDSIEVRVRKAVLAIDNQPVSIWQALDLASQQALVSDAELTTELKATFLDLSLEKITDSRWNAYFRNLKSLTNKDQIRFHFSTTQVISTATIKSLASEELFKQFGSDIDIEFEAFQMPKIRMQGSIQSVSVQFPQRIANGHFYASLRVVNDQGIERTYPLSLRCHLSKDVLIAKQNLPQGHVLQMHDFELQKLKIDLRKNYLTTSTEVVGRRLAKPLQPRLALTSEHVGLSLAVNNGDILRIKILNGSLELISSGRSLQSGQLGDVISVKDLNTQKTLYAEIISEGEVVVR